MESNNNKIIVYRNQWEKDADEFWHSETGLYTIGVLVLVILIPILGSKIWSYVKGK